MDDIPMGQREVGQTIHVDFSKWPDRMHWQYPMEYLGDDEHGRWLWAPAGTIAYRGEEGPIVLRHPRVKVISEDWWAANFLAETEGSTAIYVDIVAPATWGDDRVKMIDLDLDISARSSGELLLLDEDEFIENQVAFSYPPKLVAGATEAARRLYAAVADGCEPFATVGWRWLADALARHGDIHTG